MNHYVCPECHFVSQIRTLCPTEDCVLNGQLLKACDCDNGKHRGVVTNLDKTALDEEQPIENHGSTVDLNDEQEF